MQFRIADTFTDSLARLTAEEQKLVKTTVFDLQLDPASPGMQFHRLDKARDKNFWSIRVGSNLRLIVHRAESSLLLCYVAHHDKAYQWAERRKLEVHPQTGAVQIVEIRETVKEIVVPKYVESTPYKPKENLLFQNVSDEKILNYGVPAEWLSDVRQATEDSLLDLIEHLPAEAAEALLVLATGGIPEVAIYQATPEANPFDHPDSQRRFRIMTDVAELEQALEYPWEKWMIFLHPAQRKWIEQEYDGPIKISGSAGTGKTVVALHRAAYLARKNPDARIILTTFSETLANALKNQLKLLLIREPRLGERLEVQAIDLLGKRLFALQHGEPKFATTDQIKTELGKAAQAIPGHKFSVSFLFSEWMTVVDAWQLKTWEAYRDVLRLGRKTRLPETQRTIIWSIYNLLHDWFDSSGLTTQARVFHQLATDLAERKHPPFDFAVIDEAQDVGVPQLRFLSALGGNRPNSLFFTGDLGQRIFQQPFSWKALGVDLRGRSHVLTVNYRTSHQIRVKADSLLGKAVADVDGNIDIRSKTVSVFNGQAPIIRILNSNEEEISLVKKWLIERIAEKISPHEIGVIVRSGNELERAKAAVGSSGFPSVILDDRAQPRRDHISICTMHLAKGLEFKAVAVIACDDEVIPLQKRIEAVVDDADLEEVFNTERHLLYVACTRARDFLLVTGVKPASEFLDDLKQT